MYIPSNPGEIRKEWSSREDDRVLNEGKYLEREEKYRAYVSNSNGEKEEEHPKVQVKSLAGGSTLVGHPEREEPEQPSRIEGNCHISLDVE